MHPQNSADWLFGIRENFAVPDAFDLILAFVTRARLGIYRKLYCRLARKAFPGTNRRLAAFFLHGESYDKFLVIWFSS
jgi:hypothetical protein